MDFEGLLCRGSRVDRGLAAIHDVLQSLDFAAGDDVRIAPVQLLLRLQLLERLLVSRLGLFNLGVSRLDIRPRNQHRGVGLGDTATRKLDGSLLLRTVQPEDRCAFLYVGAETGIDSATRPTFSEMIGAL